MKKIFIFSILLMSVILISGCVDFPENTPTTTNQQVAQPNTNTQQEVKTVPTPKPSEKIYALNENVNVDYLTYKVTKVQTFKEMGTSMFNKISEGKFIKVYVRITNNAKETKEIFSPRLRIQDSEGRIFERVSDDMMYIADYIEFGKQLQPSLATSGAVVFEMPEDSKDLILLISGDFTSTSVAKVNLSSIEDIKKDTTQQDKQDKMWDSTMEESEQKVEEMMNKCNAPFKCTSSCQEYADVGKKDCPSGQVCCMQT